MSTWIKLLIKMGHVFRSQVDIDISSSNIFRNMQWNKFADEPTIVIKTSSEITRYPQETYHISHKIYLQLAWWRHQMETFSALLAICAENSPVPGEFPAQRPVTRSFDVLFDLRPNKRLGKQSWGWWSETPSSSLGRHRNGLCLLCLVVVYYRYYIISSNEITWHIYLMFVRVTLSGCSCSGGNAFSFMLPLVMRNPMMYNKKC